MREMMARMDAMKNEDVDEDAAVAAMMEERERALLGRAYADTAVVNSSRAALEARATCESYRARLYPDGEPNDVDVVRTLVVAHAVLEGHPFDAASRDVTRAIRARLDAKRGTKTADSRSENLSDIVPDDPHAESLDTALGLRENVRSNATLRLTYAFDVRNVDTGEVSRGEELTTTVPVGAAGTPHAFAMQSVWLESGVTGIEDVLKAAYSRLRDAESTASAAKIRAIGVARRGEQGQALALLGSSARIDALDRRENALDRRESALASEIVALESTVARAREESEAVRRDAARVARRRRRLAVAEDEIRRLRAVQSAVGRANDRSKTWRRGDVTTEATETRSRDAMSAPPRWPRRVSPESPPRASPNPAPPSTTTSSSRTPLIFPDHIRNVLTHDASSPFVSDITRSSRLRARARGRSLAASMKKIDYYPDDDAYGVPRTAVPAQEHPRAVVAGPNTTVVYLPPQQYASEPPPPSQPSSVPTGLPVHAERPAYLGATQGHGQQVMTCPGCGTAVRATWCA